MKVNVSEEILKNWGVYKITNTITGDCYIGSTVESIRKRVLYKHCSDYYIWNSGGNRRSTCPILYNAFRKYGIENFELTVLIHFTERRQPVRTKEIATFLEEKAITKYNPKYNVCRYPTKGGIPNLGRKLTEEWKMRIGEKSKLYRHSDVREVYEKVSQQNKEGASIYTIRRENESFTGSLVDCANYAGHHTSVLWSWLSPDRDSRSGWSIEQISTQRKGIRVYLDNEEIEFESYSKCDKHFNMWRGFTSTQVVKKRDRIMGFRYELVQ